MKETELTAFIERVLDVTMTEDKIEAIIGPILKRYLEGDEIKASMVMTYENTQYLPYMAKTPFSIRTADKFPSWPLNATRIELYGSQLMMTVGRHGGGWQVVTSGGKVVEQMYGRFPDEPHQRNFIECVKSRKRPNADIETLHPSCSMLHLANIAHRVGNLTLKYDSKAERFIGSEDANKLVKRQYRTKYEIPENV